MKQTGSSQQQNTALYLSNKNKILLNKVSSGYLNNKNNIQSIHSLQSHPSFDDIRKKYMKRYEKSNHDIPNQIHITHSNASSYKNNKNIYIQGEDVSRIHQKSNQSQKENEKVVNSQKRLFFDKKEKSQLLGIDVYAKNNFSKYISSSIEKENIKRPNLKFSKAIISTSTSNLSRNNISRLNYKGTYSGLSTNNGIGNILYSSYGNIGSIGSISQVNIPSSSISISNSISKVNNIISNSSLYGNSNEKCLKTNKPPSYKPILYNKVKNTINLVNNTLNNNKSTSINHEKNENISKVYGFLYKKPVGNSNSSSRLVNKDNYIKLNSNRKPCSIGLNKKDISERGKFQISSRRINLNQEVSESNKKNNTYSQTKGNITNITMNLNLTNNNSSSKKERKISESYSSIVNVNNVNKSMNERLKPTINLISTLKIANINTSKIKKIGNCHKENENEKEKVTQKFPTSNSHNHNNQNLILKKDKEILFPVTSSYLLSKIGSEYLYLNEFEELVNLSKSDKNEDQIYFIGEIQNRVDEKISIFNKKNNITEDTIEKKEEKEDDNQNDDMSGMFITKKGNHLNYRYEVISEIGKGSFGQAFKCIDYKHKKEVCVKIIRNKKKFTSQSKIEMRILNYINKNDINDESNVIKLLNSFTFRGHVCLVFELLDINLYELLKYQDFNGLDMNVIRKISIQLLYTLIFLQKSSIIHCDLKPENILLKTFGKTGIKVIDFGSSCFEGEKLYTYIQSRFYRAPEIILGFPYGIEIDMWSFGCIIIELYTGIPIFPGENEKDQIGYIMEYIGLPSVEILSKSKKRSCFFEFDYKSNQYIPLKYMNSRGKVRIANTKRLQDFLKGADDAFISFVKRCLEWDPSKRIKPDEAILNDWITIGMPVEIYDFHKRNYENRIKSSLGGT